MIWEIVIAILLGGLLVGMLVWMRRKESRILGSRTREVLSASLREEIEEERSAALKRQEQFEEALKNAGK